MERRDEAHSEIERTLHEASELAKERDESATMRDGPPAARRARTLAAVGIAFAAVAAWDVYVLSRPPETLPPQVTEIDVRVMVATAVEAVEDFRTEEGRLPTPAEIEAVLDEDITYSARGDRYLISAEVGGTRIEYDGDEPLDDWIVSAETASGGSS